MILTTLDLDTREEPKREGRYLDGMAVYLDSILGGEDEFAGDFSTIGCGTRFGRRILWVDCMGFTCSERFPTPKAAHDALAAAFPNG